MPSQTQKEAYKNILKFYDRADEIIDMTENLGEKGALVIPHVEVLVETIEKNTEILVNNFLKYMESGKTLSGVEKLRMEKAKKEIGDAVNYFLANI